MHYLIRADAIRLVPAYTEQSGGFNRCSLIDRSCGAVHTGLGLCTLDPGGRINNHLHSFEESFFVLEGEPTLVLDGQGYRLTSGACGIIPLGLRHAWLGPKNGVAKWIDMLVPQPRGGDEPVDTFFLGAPQAGSINPLDIRDPRSRHFFYLRDSDMQVDKLKVGAHVDAPTVSASMATALLAYSGITVKMLVDQRLDAHLHTMFMVEYQPDGIAHLHDHPLEEAYYILDGEVDAVADGKRYSMRVGDVLWTGVGCIHAFYNVSNTTVRWLETQSPQPPAKYSYRFNRDWEYLKKKLATSSSSS
jgi:quercetin dioxygenase-like cupin family protein